MIRQLQTNILNAFNNPAFLGEINDIKTDDGCVQTSLLKADYQIISELNRDNGDLVIYFKDFEDAPLIISQAERLQYAAYMIQKCAEHKTALQTILDNPKITDDAQTRRNTRKDIYNLLTGADEYADLMGESCQAAVSAVKLTNKAIRDITDLRQIKDDELSFTEQRLDSSVLVADTFIKTLNSANRTLSADKREKLRQALVEAYQIYTANGSLPDDFATRHALSDNKVLDGIRRISNRQTDNEILQNCLNAMVATFEHHDVQKIAKMYISGNIRQAQTDTSDFMTETQSQKNALAAEKKNVPVTELIRTALMINYLNMSLAEFRFNMLSEPHNKENELSLADAQKVLPLNPIQEAEKIETAYPLIMEKDIKTLNLSDHTIHKALAEKRYSAETIAALKVAQKNNSEKEALKNTKDAFSQWLNTQKVKTAQRS